MSTDEFVFEVFWVRMRMIVEDEDEVAEQGTGQLLVRIWGVIAVVLSLSNSPQCRGFFFRPRGHSGDKILYKTRAHTKR